MKNYIQNKNIKSKN